MDVELLLRKLGQFLSLTSESGVAIGEGQALDIWRKFAKKCTKPLHRKKVYIVTPLIITQIRLELTAIELPLLAPWTSCKERFVLRCLLPNVVVCFAGNFVLATEVS